MFQTKFLHCIATILRIVVDLQIQGDRFIQRAFSIDLLSFSSRKFWDFKCANGMLKRNPIFVGVRNLNHHRHQDHNGFEQSNFVWIRIHRRAENDR
jgi:hypothetical protein